MCFSSEIKLYSEISIYKQSSIERLLLRQVLLQKTLSDFFYPRLISERKCGLAKSKLYLSHLKQKITKCAFLTDLY